ncbi:MAG: hypothetical protein IH913_02460 [Proteobacteria bacterium]|nr:hypothetical protein [Pseudomonadota bacterium]
MSEKKVLKPLALAVGAALAGSFAISGTVHADAIDSPFAMTTLSVGYMLGDDEGHDKDGEGNCGGDKEGEGSCGDKEGEGSCGDKEGEGSCGDKEGEGSCGDKEGEGSCGEDKDAEGSCGEGSCGGSI